MKTEQDKRNNREYSITITIQFPLYLTKKEVEEGTEIPKKIISEEVMKCIENGEYDVNEEPME